MIEEYMKTEVKLILRNMTKRPYYNRQIYIAFDRVPLKGEFIDLSEHPCAEELLGVFEVVNVCTCPDGDSSDQIVLYCNLCLGNFLSGNFLSL
jgi:hypothetical protein